MHNKTKYQFLTTNNIKPAGWLKTQLRIQADGLNGNLDKVWSDVRDSAWIGGKCEGWERVPYWLDGFIPLAYLLEDEDLIARAKRYIDAIISFQAEDGWICPCSEAERENYDTWAVLLILKVLALYGDCSGEERIVDVVEKCLKNFDLHLNKNTLRNWGAARWFEGLISIFWLYEKRPGDWLINMAKKLRAQGFDWKGMFKTDFIDTCTDYWDYHSHVVNICMMLKSEALWSQIFDIDAEELADLALEYLDKKHGTAAGHFTGDENISGNSPIHGTELCGVVEAMYSYEWLFAVTGNTKWLDRLEKLAFNALPAAISPDMWTHQYDQMTNQVASFPMSKQPFRTNNNEAHLFGLEPHFGCCTSNFGQGFPKLALTSFMCFDKGIASCALVPSLVELNINGSKVKCELITEYPFRNTLKYIINTEAPTAFTLSIRIPACAKAAFVDGKEVATGGFFDIEREWNGRAEINVELTFETEIVSRPRDMVAVWRGPLMYSVAIEEKWEKVEYEKDGVERKFPYCDYYIYPMSKWNYALADDRFEVAENSFTNAFDTKNPPISMVAKMNEIEWGFNNGHCDEEPTERVAIGETVDVKMIPYGCTNLRMTEIPYLK